MTYQEMIAQAKKDVEAGHQLPVAAQKVQVQKAQKAQRGNRPYRGEYGAPTIRRDGSLDLSKF